MVAKKLKLIPIPIGNNNRVDPAGLTLLTHPGAPSGSVIFIVSSSSSSSSNSSIGGSKSRYTTKYDVCCSPSAAVLPLQNY